MNLSLTEIQRRRGELVERARAEREAVRAWGLFRLFRRISRAFA